MRSLLIASLSASLSLVGLVGCTNEPIYLPSPMNLEAGMDDGLGMGELVVGRSSLMIPVVTETMEDRMDREAQQAIVDPSGVVEVPYVKVGDLEVSVEWTIRNLTDMPGQAMIQLNGANQFFEYDPTMVVLSTEREAPPTPGLAGDIPLNIPANGEIQGLFKEDELREASIDLDQITRGNINPFKATLTISKNAEKFLQYPPPMYNMDGEPIMQDPIGEVPREAFPQLLRVDLVFTPNRHMVFEYTVRVRDVRHDLIHELGVTALTDPTAMGELQPFAPMMYASSPTP